LLVEAGINPADVRLLRHLPQVGGRLLLDIWRTEPETLTSYQSLQPVEARSSFSRPYWASFIATWDGRTVFVGLHQVLGREEMEEQITEALTNRQYAPSTVDRYDTAAVPALDQYRGRLFIEWGGGASGKRAWNQRADVQNKEITELHLDVSEPPFPGLLKINSPLSQLTTVPPSWIEHLKEARGVYLLSCPRDGSLYVGSATAAGGFWSRWSEYLGKGHGGNIGLVDRPPSDFHATILQVAGSGETPEEILAAEASWKEKLHTRVWGLNRN